MTWLKIVVKKEISRRPANSDWTPRNDMLLFWENSAGDRFYMDSRFSQRGHFVAQE